MAGADQQSMTFTDVSLIASSVNKFTASLFKVVAEMADEKENIFISPLSVFMGLAMARVGARGSTAQQLNVALNLKEDLKEGSSVNYLLSYLLQNPKGAGNTTLKVANGIYVAHKYKLLEEFEGHLIEFFGNSLESIDFGDADANRIINSWVEECTLNKIQNLIPPGILNYLTKLVLVNAVYFKGSWLQKFDEKLTAKAPFFWGADGEEVEVSMMHSINAEFPVGVLPELDARILELPYEEKTFSMFVILPNRVDGLRFLESKIFSSNLLEELSQPLQSTKLHVAIPKFKVETTVKMNNPLMKLGILDLFDQTNADLSGISGDNELYVSDTFHKAFIEINEEGSEAAASTVNVARLKRSLEVDVEEPFIADHPCLVALQHKETKLWIFIGHLTIPNDHLYHGLTRDEL